MEARSLASLNLLAGNPPQYPEKPSEEKQEPLILYISRVPGTRDIILSPFKPQLKNVTGEDVASSLYYVHLEPPSSELPSPASRASSPAMTIPRKPLPASALSLAPSLLPESSSCGNQNLRPVNAREDHTLLPSERGVSFNSHNQSAVTVPPRPMNDSSPGMWDSSSDGTNPPTPKLVVSTPKPKPLGPRQMMNPLGEDPNNVLRPRLQDSFLTDENVPRARDFMRSRADTLRSRADCPGLGRNSRSISPRKRDEYLTTPFTLSLIRRDPGTGSQWNVGKISSHEVDSLSGGNDRSSVYLSAPVEPSHSQHPPIDIQIETSGYAKFRAMPSRRSMDTSASHSRRPSMDVSGSPRNVGGSFFSRQVVMSYSKSWTSNLKTKFQQIEQAARKKAHSRRGSAASFNSISSVDSAPGSPTSGQPDRQSLKPRGYVFSSPWDGRCEFRTGSGGRSVLCHHILNGGLTTAYNPLVADLASNTPKSAAPVVSELRFNLPGSDLFPPSDSPKDSKERRLGHFSKLLRSAAGVDPDDDDDTVSPFDVNLGGEDAGGGNRGKRAKLGKLIVYHDGLKMLDLLVAANMGLWWGSWERSF